MVCRRVRHQSASPHRYRARTHLCCKGNCMLKRMRATGKPLVPKMGTFSLTPFSACVRLRGGSRAARRKRKRRCRARSRAKAEIRRRTVRFTVLGSLFSETEASKRDFLTTETSVPLFRAGHVFNSPQRNATRVIPGVLSPVPGLPFACRSGRCVNVN